MTVSRLNMAPAVFLQINGKPADDLIPILVSFKHKKTVDKPHETHFVFKNDKRNLYDDPRFAPNTHWVFRYGYLDDMSPNILGIIQEVEPDYADAMKIQVTLKDKSSLMGNFTHAKKWGRVKSSDVAKAIAKKYGWKAEVDDSKDLPVKALVQPKAVSDIGFLRDLAALIDFEVFTQGEPPVLIYRKKAYADKPVAQFTYFDNQTERSIVKSFKVKIKHDKGKSGVSGADGAKGKGIGATAGANNKQVALGRRNVVVADTGGSLLDGGLVGPPNVHQDNELMSREDVRNAVVRPITIDRSDPEMASQERYWSVPLAGGFADNLLTRELRSPNVAMVKHLKNAAAIAAAAHNAKLDLKYEATSTHILTPSVDAGTLYTWAGLDKGLNGPWYVKDVTDTINGSGSDTHIDWKRNSPSTGTSGGDKSANKNVNTQEAGAQGKVTKKVTVIAGNTGTALNTAKLGGVVVIK